MARPDRWLVLTARIDTDDPLRDLVGEGLLAFGSTSILETPDGLTTYLEPPADGDADTLVEQVSAFLEDWIADTPPELVTEWQANEDWEREWKRGLEPRKVSRRFVVKPSWTSWNAAPDELVIEIDPEMAFGTGEHATTRGCLRLLDAHIRDGDRVLDIGSGSGILSIAAARLGASEVIAVEYDADANLNARENFERNGVAGSVDLREVLADPEYLASLGTFDLILANILSGVIRPLLSALKAALRPGGRLIVSGILLRESEAVLEDARAAGLVLAEDDREEEWWSACLVHDSSASPAPAE